MLAFRAVRTDAGKGGAEAARFERVVIPRDRRGGRSTVSAHFTKLTGLDDARIAGEGVELAAALADFAAFAGDDLIWAWGNDELFAIAISCYLAGLAPPIPAARFANATRLFVKAGIDRETVAGLRSGTMCAQFALEPPEGRGHDALFDAMSVARVIGHLLQTGRLAPEEVTGGGHALA